MGKINLAGNVAIVTGAGTGIGREIALLLAQHGARVLVNDYGGDFSGHAGTEKRAESVANEIMAIGGEAIANRTAVGTPEAAREIVATAMDAFGRIDVLVNNAGVTLPGALARTAQEDIERIIQVNLWGTYNLMRAVWPIMEARHYGRIVNLTSNAVMGGYGGFSSYSASKGAVLGLTGDAGAEGKPLGILVNALAPIAHTRLAGDDVMAAPEDFTRWLKKNFPASKIAPLAVYLASPEAAVSGEVFCVGGGRVSRLAFANAEGYFSNALTADEIATHIDQIRNMQNAAVLCSGQDDMNRYMPYVPALENSDPTPDTSR